VLLEEARDDATSESVSVAVTRRAAGVRRAATGIVERAADDGPTVRSVESSRPSSTGVVHPWIECG